MKSVDGVGHAEVTDFYNGDGGSIVALVMGELAHVGGLRSTLELAALAGIGPGDHGVDLGCNQGAGMRALIRLCGVESMTGIDLSAAMVDRGRQRCEELGFGESVLFVVADACTSGQPTNSADFAWSEDAWVYVVDKERVVAEAARMVRPGGLIAFTDWVIGPQELDDDEAGLLLASMSFPSIASIDDYVRILERTGCSVSTAEDTECFGEAMTQITNILERQLEYDALQILDFDSEGLATVREGFRWLAELGHDGKIAQARFVASVPSS